MRLTKNKILICSVLFLGAFDLLNAQPKTMIQISLQGIIHWEYAGGDEFNGTELNESYWSHQFFDGPNRYGVNPCYYLKENVEFTGTSVKLLAKNQPGIYSAWHFDSKGNLYTVPEFFQYTGGLVESRLQYKYGLYEIRCIPPAGQGHYPAFWFYGPGKDGHDEIDVFEMKGEYPNQTHWNLHCTPCGKKDNAGNWVTATGNLTAGFNNYSLEWKPGKQIWSLNNIEYAASFHDFDYGMNVIANNSPSQEVCKKKHWWENNQHHGFCGAADNTTPFPAAFEIDYIRIWTRSNDSSIVLDKSSGPVSQKNTLSKKDSVSRLSIQNPPSNKNDKNGKNKIYLTIYPDPSLGILEIEIGEIPLTNLIIEVTNATGEKVYTKTVVNTDKHFTIDLSAKPGGTYFLKIIADKKTFDQKIILQH